VIDPRANPFPPVVKNLLIINVLFLLATFVRPDLVHTLGLHYWKSQDFAPYQVVTHFFMHGGIAHIFFNMFALWMFGGPLENVWGPKRFLLFYIVTALGAAVVHLIVIHLRLEQLTAELPSEMLNEIIRNGGEVIRSGQRYTDSAMDAVNGLYNGPTVGASGAVFGILLGFAMLFPNVYLYLYFAIPIKAKYVVAGYVLIELYLGFVNSPGDNVAHFAHLGGALFGFILIKIWQRSRKRFY
jgi:membrane associated rhomboid family serine protease